MKMLRFIIFIYYPDDWGSNFLRNCSRLHEVTSQKTAIFTFVAVWMYLARKCLTYAGMWQDKNITLLSLIRTRQCPKLFRVRKTRIFCRRRHSILTRPQLNRQGAILICLIAYSFIYWYIPSFILYISETLLSLYYVWENIPTDSYRTLLITGWYPCFLFRMSRFRISTRSFPQSFRYKFRENTLHIAFFHILYNSLTINRPIIRRKSR